MTEDTRQPGIGEFIEFPEEESSETSVEAAHPAEAGMVELWRKDIGGELTRDCLCFDGRYVAAVGKDSLHYFDLEGTEVWKSKRFSGDNPILRLSDGGKLLAAGFGRFLYLFRRNGELVSKTEVLPGVLDVGFLPDQRLAVLCSGSLLGTPWSRAVSLSIDGEELSRHDIRKEILAARWLPHRQCMAAVEEDNRITLMPFDDTSEVTFQLDEEVLILDAGYSYGSDALLVQTLGHHVLLNSGDTAPLKCKTLPGEMSSLSPDGKALVSATIGQINRSVSQWRVGQWGRSERAVQTDSWIDRIFWTDCSTGEGHSMQLQELLPQTTSDRARIPHVAIAAGPKGEFIHLLRPRGYSLIRHSEGKFAFVLAKKLPAYDGMIPSHDARYILFFKHSGTLALYAYGDPEKLRDTPLRRAYEDKERFKKI